MIAMKVISFFIYLSLIVAIQGAAIAGETKKCEGVTINGIYYEKETLITGLDRPYNLAVDFGTNTLYFSYSLNKTDDVFKTVKINLYTKESAEVDGVENGFAQTVDQKNHVPYIGGSNGIYKYDYSTNKAYIVTAFDIDIWDIYFKDVLYYSDHPSQFLYTVIDDVIERFKDLDETKVSHFAIDSDDVMFFTNATGLYSQPTGTKDAYLYKNLVNGDGVRGITTDVNGRVYICFDDGIYKAITSIGTLEKVVDVYDAFGVAFDANNNIVYADATSVVHLKPKKDNKCQ